MEDRFSIGIDPGWKNMGVALVGTSRQLALPGFKPIFKVNVLKAFTKDMSSSTEEEVLSLKSQLGYSQQIENVCIERYAPYANIKTAESENITNLIGMLRMNFYIDPLVSDIILIRAIDWKMEVVKLLNKHFGFENPSSDLNKKFSLAAANFICTNPEVIKNDHEADAVLLAALPLLRKALI